jgi:hypothetical protein
LVEGENLATLESGDVQLTTPVMSLVLPSSNVPVAVSWILVPFGSVELAGEMEIEVRFDRSTVRDAVALCGPNKPVTVLVPTAWPMAKPLPPVINPGEELQAVTLVTSCWLLSLKVAVAVNCCCFPSPTLAVLGVIAKDVSVTSLMLMTAVFETPLSEAVISTVPGEGPAVSNPWVGARLLMLAILDTGQDHWAVKVRSFVLPSP